MNIKNIGKYCKQYREQTLDMGLVEFSKKVGENYKNINAFEYGRANNIKYLNYYYKVSTDTEKEDFLINLFEVI